MYTQFFIYERVKCTCIDVGVLGNGNHGVILLFCQFGVRTEEGVTTFVCQFGFLNGVEPRCFFADLSL